MDVFLEHCLESFDVGWCKVVSLCNDLLAVWLAEKTALISTQLTTDSADHASQFLGPFISFRTYYISPLRLLRDYASLTARSVLYSMKYMKKLEIYSSLKAGKMDATEYKIEISEYELREEVRALLNQLDVEVSFSRYRR